MGFEDFLREIPALPRGKKRPAHHYHQVQAQSYRALVYIIPALAAAVLINITKFMEVEPAELCTDFTDCNCDVVIE